MARESHLSDVSYVPQELVEAGGIEVALGLWIPKTGYYLQPSGELRVDEFGRTRLEPQHSSEAEPH